MESSLSIFPFLSFFFPADLFVLRAEKRKRNRCRYSRERAIQNYSEIYGPYGSVRVHTEVEGVIQDNWLSTADGTPRIRSSDGKKRVVATFVFLLRTETGIDEREAFSLPSSVCSAVNNVVPPAFVPAGLLPRRALAAGRDARRPAAPRAGRARPARTARGWRSAPAARKDRVRNLRNLKKQPFY